MTHEPASLSHHLLDETAATGLLWDEARGTIKIQSERHETNFLSLYQASENTALFLPDRNGQFTAPPFLLLIDGVRPYIGQLNVARNAARATSLFNVATPECAHGLGCTDWVLHCKGVKHKTEQYLLHKLKDYGFSGEEIALLTTVLIANGIYLHDVVEDNRKRRPWITPKFLSLQALKRTFGYYPYVKVLHPYLVHTIAAFTDDPNLHGPERLLAQHIPPQLEYEEYSALGIITKTSDGTGVIGTGKFADKFQTLTSDLMILLTGQKSFFEGADHFAAYIQPRLKLVESLHVPMPYKSIFRETAERITTLLKTPARTPMARVKVQKLIRHELFRIKNVLAGGPHVPVKTQPYVRPCSSVEACP